jgi:hypothetical protein
VGRGQICGAVFYVILFSFSLFHEQTCVRVVLTKVSAAGVGGTGLDSVCVWGGRNQSHKLFAVWCGGLGALERFHGSRCVHMLWGRSAEPQAAECCVRIKGKKRKATAKSWRLGALEHRSVPDLPRVFITHKNKPSKKTPRLQWFYHQW